jgi:DNA-binding NtrC family response regulator
MPRILIVDDEGSILTLLAAVFNSAGYEVRTAGDGREAVAICQGERFDAVLSDVVMPTMNGHELVRWVAKQYPSTRTLLMSGFDPGCEGCPLAPRCELLKKPFRPSEAVSFVDRVLNSPQAS